VYVGLLLIALVAQLAGILFLFLYYNSYPDKAPPKVSDRPPALAPSGPAPGGAGQQGVPPGGAQGAPPGGGAQGVPPAGGRGAPPAGGQQGAPPGQP
jgi:hypothetical protein